MESVNTNFSDESEIQITRHVVSASKNDMSAPSFPIVIALIPGFNPGEYLRESVTSLLHQTQALHKLVVIDDGSTDNSFATLADLEMSGSIEIHRNETNMGRAASLNAAFLRYEADYFILQDADDVAKPERVARQVAFMEEHPEVGCSSSFIDYIDKTGRKIAKGKLDLLDDERLAEYLAGNEPFGLFCPAVILRASVVKNPQFHFRGQFWPADDIDLWNRIAETGFKVRAQPERLVGYRIHGNSAVTSGFTRTRMQFEWLRSCLRARRAGLPEPTQEEFLVSWNSVPIWKKINRSRKIFAKGLYRSAGFAVSEQRRLHFIAFLFISFVLSPVYVVHRIWQQIKQ